MTHTAAYLKIDSFLTNLSFALKKRQIRYLSLDTSLENVTPDDLKKLTQEEAETLKERVSNMGKSLEKIKDMTPANVIKNVREFYRKLCGVWKKKPEEITQPDLPGLPPSIPVRQKKTSVRKKSSADIQTFLPIKITPKKSGEWEYTTWSTEPLTPDEIRKTFNVPKSRNIYQMASRKTKLPNSTGMIIPPDEIPWLEVWLKNPNQTQLVLCSLRKESKPSKSGQIRNWNISKVYWTREQFCHENGIPLDQLREIFRQKPIRYGNTGFFLLPSRPHYAVRQVKYMWEKYLSHPSIHKKDIFQWEKTYLSLRGKRR
jgi:hypothetical protein